MWDRKELKARGRAAFKANYWKCVLVAFLLSAFVLGSVASAGGRARSEVEEATGGSVQNMDVSFDGGEVTINGQTYASIQDAVTAIGEAENADPEQVAALNDMLTSFQADPEGAAVAVGAIVAIVIGVLLIVGLVASLFHILLINPLEVGCQSFFTRNAEAPAELGELGNGFHPYGRNVGAMFLRGLFLFLWSLLLIVPGVIKSYSYRMVPYILADDPTISGKDAITLSRRMMDGQKWNAFVLDLSFLGWILLSVLTLGILGVFYVNPYRFSTNAELYHTLKAAQ